RLFVTSSNTACFTHGRRGEFSHCRRRTLVRVCSGLRLANPTWYAHHQHVHQQLSLLHNSDTGANTTEIDTGSSKCVGFDPGSPRPGTRELASTQDLEWWIYAHAYQDRRRTHGRARPRALAGPAAGALAVQPRRDRLALAGGAPVARLSVAATSWRTQA